MDEESAETRDLRRSRDRLQAEVMQLEEKIEWLRVRSDIKRLYKRVARVAGVALLLFYLAVQARIHCGAFGY